MTLNRLLLPVLETFGNHWLLKLFSLSRFLSLSFFSDRIFCFFIVANDVAYSLILNGSHNHLYVSSCLLLEETCLKLFTAESV